ALVRARDAHAVTLDALQREGDARRALALRATPRAAPRDGGVFEDAVVEEGREAARAAARDAVDDAVVLDDAREAGEVHEDVRAIASDRRAELRGARARNLRLAFIRPLVRGRGAARRDRRDRTSQHEGAEKTK